MLSRFPKDPSFRSAIRTTASSAVFNNRGTKSQVARNGRPLDRADTRASSFVGCILFVSFSVAVLGCTGRRSAKPVEVDLAKDTLTRVLDHWKQGGAMTDFRKQSPEIVIQEVEWSNGRQLLDYELVGGAQALDGNWFCEVELKLGSADGKRVSNKKVTY
ncbi:MAG: hypothetical protein KDB22_16485, partial [Planctomycetales bacterium]|nr:hypothetical protein [Planctomycetales bacterium]